MDVTPLISSDSKVIQSYVNGKFKVSGDAYDGAILVWPDHVDSWPDGNDKTVQNLTVDDFNILIKDSKELDVVLLGTGSKMAFLPAPMRSQLKQAGLQIEYMDTAAACRTYNVLLSEGRRVVAALLPVA